MLPWLVIGLTNLTGYARFTRGQMVETFDEDYMRTAQGKGLPMRRRLFKHALRASIAPVITIFGLDFATLLGGVVFVEQIFGINGIAYWGLQRAQPPAPIDINVVSATVLVGAVLDRGSQPRRRRTPRLPRSPSHPHLTTTQRTRNATCQFSRAKAGSLRPAPTADRTSSRVNDQDGHLRRGRGVGIHAWRDRPRWPATGHREDPGGRAARTLRPDRPRGSAAPQTPSRTDSLRGPGRSRPADVRRSGDGVLRNRSRGGASERDSEWDLVVVDRSTTRRPAAGPPRRVTSADPLSRFSGRAPWCRSRR